MVISLLLICNHIFMTFKGHFLNKTQNIYGFSIMYNVPFIDGVQVEIFCYVVFLMKLFEFSLLYSALF